MECLVTSVRTENKSECGIWGKCQGRILACVLQLSKELPEQQALPSEGLSH